LLILESKQSGYITNFVILNNITPQDTPKLGDIYLEFVKGITIKKRSDTMIPYLFYVIKFSGFAYICFWVTRKLN